MSQWRLIVRGIDRDENDQTPDTRAQELKEHAQVFVDNLRGLGFYIAAAEFTYDFEKNLLPPVK